MAEGIVIKNFNGQEVTYENVEKVKFNTSDGGTQIYTRGEAVENVEIVPDFSNGDQIINAVDGMLVKSAVIKMPETLIPENIAKGVEIAGVVGTSEGGGGSDFDATDENLKYFTYQINIELKTITLFSILYSDLYADKGSYDVNIPDTLGGYKVIIRIE